MKICIVVVSMILAHCTASAFLAGKPLTLDQWVEEVPTIVTGVIVEVDPVESRELESGRPAGVVFPHAVARIFVEVVVKNESAVSVAEGDTIAVLHLTNDDGWNPDVPNEIVLVEDLLLPGYRTGQSSVFGIRLNEADWWPCSRQHSREIDELSEIQSAWEECRQLRGRKE